jgi:pimeloyl-ACP methyl ester carboxylesterase
MFTSQFIPGATKEQADWFNEAQRISSSPAGAARNLIANGDVDVTSLLPQVQAPTLVMHARHDARVLLNRGGGWPRESREPASFPSTAKIM